MSKKTVLIIVGVLVFFGMVGKATPAKTAQNAPQATEQEQPTQTPTAHTNKRVRPSQTPKPTRQAITTQATAQATVARTSDSYPCTAGQIKGNRTSKIYHVPGGTSYARTKKNVGCYDTEKDAQGAGYTKAKK
jgi:micrococcal nuclease